MLSHTGDPENATLKTAHKSKRVHIFVGVEFLRRFASHEPRPIMLVMGAYNNLKPYDLGVELGGLVDVQLTSSASADHLHPRVRPSYSELRTGYK